MNEESVTDLKVWCPRCGGQRASIATRLSGMECGVCDGEGRTDFGRARAWAEKNAGNMRKVRLMRRIQEFVEKHLNIIAFIVAVLVLAFIAGIVLFKWH